MIHARVRFFMSGLRTKKFHNDGFGWICDRCENGRGPGEAVEDRSSRLLSEGESEEKIPNLSTRSLAQWTTSDRQELLCPSCGTTEYVGN